MQYICMLYNLKLSRELISCHTVISFDGIHWMFEISHEVIWLYSDITLRLVKDYVSHF